MNLDISLDVWREYLDCLGDDDELEELASEIVRILRAVETVHVVFNINYDDQRQRNVRSLMGILGVEPNSRRQT